MSLEADMRLLSQVPLFSSFDESQLRLLAFGAEQRRVVAGAQLFRQGAYSDGGYVVVEGQVDLYDGEKLIESHGPGTLLGELALITATDHSVTAICPHGGMVLAIPRPLFRRMLEEYPALIASLQASISERMHAFLEKLEAIRERL